MKLNVTPVLDLSTEHLSEQTGIWMERLAKLERDFGLRNSGKGPTISIMEREEGFLIGTHHADPEISTGAKMPGDLFHVLRFARANGMEHVLFDRDGPVQDGLPLYETIGKSFVISPDHPWIGSDVEGAIRTEDLDGTVLNAPDPQRIRMEDLRVASASLDGIEDFIDAAKIHGEDSEPGHEVGDLQDMLREVWWRLEPEERARAMVSEPFRNVMEATSIEEPEGPGQ